MTYFKLNVKFFKTIFLSSQVILLITFIEGKNEKNAWHFDKGKRRVTNIYYNYIRGVKVLLLFAFNSTFWVEKSLSRVLFRAKFFHIYTPSYICVFEWVVHSFSTYTFLNYYDDLRHTITLSLSTPKECFFACFSIVTSERKFTFCS